MEPASAPMWALEILHSILGFMTVTLDIVPYDEEIDPAKSPIETLLEVTFNSVLVSLVIWQFFNVRS